MEGRFQPEGEATILDTETGLLWQRNASPGPMVWKNGFAYVDQLNRSNFAGYNDWRYPTREELSQLICKEEDRNTGLHICSVFGKQRNCWTSTEEGHHKAEYVDFYYGDVYVVEQEYANYYVRAVRKAE